MNQRAPSLSLLVVVIQVRVSLFATSYIITRKYQLELSYLEPKKVTDFMEKWSQNCSFTMNTILLLLKIS